MDGGGFDFISMSSLDSATIVCSSILVSFSAFHRSAGFGLKLGMHVKVGRVKSAMFDDTSHFGPIFH